MAGDPVERGRLAARRLAELECCVLEPGLSDSEFDRVERTFGVRFADDHRAFLAVALPVAEPRDETPGVTYAWERPWPHWRESSYAELRTQVDAPTRGLLQQVPRGFWHPAWGERPRSQRAALTAARQALDAVPRLVPVYAHRYLPAAPFPPGHAVLSIWGGDDIVWYGADLLDYIDREFIGPERDRPPRPDVTVPFWRDLFHTDSGPGRTE